MIFVDALAFVLCIVALLAVLYASARASAAEDRIKHAEDGTAAVDRDRQAALAAAARAQADADAARAETDRQRAVVAVLERANADLRLQLQRVQTPAQAVEALGRRS